MGTGIVLSTPGREYREDQKVVDLTLGELRASEYKKPYGGLDRWLKG